MNGVATATDRSPSASRSPPEKLGTEGGLRDGVDAQQAVQSAVEHAHRHEHARRRRRLAVGVRLPRVHGSEARLRAVADEGEDDAELQGQGMELARHGDEARPVEAGHALAEDAPARCEEQHGAEQREGEAEAPEHQELPGRLQRRVAVVEGDQEDRREGRDLHRDPQDPEVVRDRDQQHREDVERDEGVELPASPGRARARGPRCASCTRRCTPRTSVPRRPRGRARAPRARRRATPPRRPSAAIPRGTASPCAIERRNVKARPPTRLASLSQRRRGKTPRSAVSNGTVSVQRSRVTMANP